MSAENQDDGQKSEQPTQHRIEKSKEKGNIPQSRDLYHAVIFASFLLFVWLWGRHFVASLFTLERSFLEAAGTQRADGPMLLYVVRQLCGRVAWHLLLFFLMLSCVLIAGLGLQTRWRLKPDAFQMDLSKLSPFKGFKRLFSLKNLFEFFKSFFKFCVIFLLVLFLGKDMFWEASGFCGADPFWALLGAEAFIKRGLLFALILICVMAAADYGYQWYSWLRQLLMSRREILDEQKEVDKNPQTTMRQRQFRRDMQQMRVAKEKVPEATVLITNPTHYAMALLWTPHRMMAPEVIAKGADNVALYMRRIAEKHNIPRVENPELAQSLYKSLNVGDVIAPAHYKAVAEIIRYVMRLRAQKRDDTTAEARS